MVNTKKNQDQPQKKKMEADFFLISKIFQD